MKNKIYKVLGISALFIFFMSVPFLQSFIFLSNTQGKIEVDKKIEAHYINSDKKIVLLFFGYVGCTDACTPLLERLSALYESREFEAVREGVDIIFINITPEVQEYQPELFAKFFNPAFRGIYLSKKETLNIDRTFGMFFSRSMSDKTEVDHTDYLYLVKNDSNAKILKSIYSVHPFNKEKIIEDIKQLQVKKDEEL